MSFTQKLINVQFNLAKGSFGKNGDNTAMVSGLRVAFTCAYVGGFEQGQAQITIYGLPLSLMNQLTTFGKQQNQMGKNHIAVFAGEDPNNMSVVFEGNILSAFVDGQAQPDVAFQITATPGNYHAVTPATPISVKGSADAAGLMKQIAGKMGLGFENAGVTAKLSNPYFAGSLWTQAQQIAEHCGFDWTVDRKTLAIVQPGKNRDSPELLISPQTGMVGYPAFYSGGVIVKSLFNPNFKHYGLITVQSDLTPACGKWKTKSVVLELESMVPNGKWFMTFETTPADAGAGPA